jgi:hypothetical protein
MPVGTGRDNDPLEPPEGERYGTVWDRVSLSDAAKWRLTNFALAMGLTVNKNGTINGTLEIEPGKPGSIIGKLALLRVKGGQIQSEDPERNGAYRAEAGNWAPFDGTDTGEGFDDEEAEGEPSDGFDDEAEDEAGEEEDFYTEESLDGLDNTELKAAAEEFDLDVSTLVVKNRAKKTDVPKTRAAIIAAILEAQGVVDEDEEEAEEPF